MYEIQTYIQRYTTKKKKNEELMCLYFLSVIFQTHFKIQSAGRIQELSYLTRIASNRNNFQGINGFYLQSEIIFYCWKRYFRSCTRLNRPFFMYFFKRCDWLLTAFQSLNKRIVPFRRFRTCIPLIFGTQLSIHAFLKPLGYE